LTKVYNKSETLYKRKKLRTDQTEAESVLWSKLRDNQLDCKFRRQYSIGAYIVDFYCPQCKIAVELDGSQHYSEEGLEYDKARTEFINAFNVKVVRFSNLEVMKNLVGVLETIKQEMQLDIFITK